ncbi:hypothetical protein HanLR1_Chr01g0006591 [Helianthus annuus]|nr:hypothetical protein HanHA89_Chr01g0007461 [Helianthus annuus]KAJ0782306.1 hypothetical protein HanLR1_Chr01g0006591 [Helianthus annuus]
MPAAPALAATTPFSTRPTLPPLRHTKIFPSTFFRSSAPSAQNVLNTHTHTHIYINIHNHQY